MDFLARLRGTYTQDLHELKQERDALIDRARDHLPEDYLEQLKSNEDGEFEHPLEWVEVADPNSDDPDSTLEVQPRIGVWEGEDDGKTPAIKPGLASIALSGRLPGGEEQRIGTLTALGGNHNPLLLLNNPRTPQGVETFTEWESADAEIFLELASSALQAQSV